MKDLHIRTLRRAAEILGGEDALQKQLAVPQARLRQWLDGAADVPSNVFLACVDVVVQQDTREAMQGSPRPLVAEQDKVLVVDDDEAGAYALARLIRALGHPVEIARDGLTAIEIAVRWRPDVVFLDLRMPSMDGVQVAERLRAEGIDAQIIAATNYGSEDDRRLTAEAGFAAHLVKPIDAQSLDSVLQRRGGGRA